MKTVADVIREVIDSHDNELRVQGQVYTNREDLADALKVIEKMPDIFLEDP